MKIDACINDIKVKDRISRFPDGMNFIESNRVEKIQLLTLKTEACDHPTFYRLDIDEGLSSSS